MKYTIKQASKLTNICERSFYYLMSKGNSYNKMKYTKEGKIRYISFEELHSFIFCNHGWKIEPYRFNAAGDKIYFKNN